MILQERIQLMSKLGQYLEGEDAEWLECKERAFSENPWFIPDFINKSVSKIVSGFLQTPLLENWATKYHVSELAESPKTVGLVMAGNIPLVGFHDFLCVFVSGHKIVMKSSSKDTQLIKHLIKKLTEWDSRITDLVSFSERLKGCDAYIATGSNNSSRYFDYYFGKYPNIIRKNRTSVAILDNTETTEELIALADDIQLYFGLGCRNITKLWVHNNYDFLPLLNALKQYAFLMDYHKYLHNFVYHLALLIMGNRYYMNNDSVILTQNTSVFSPVSQVHYEFYENRQLVIDQLTIHPDIQCIVGHENISFGMAQSPALTDYADGVDTMAFLGKL